MPNEINLTYYWKMEREGLIKVLSADLDGVYYVDLTDGTGYCVITDGVETHEFYCDSKKQYRDYKEQFGS